MFIILKVLRGLAALALGTAAVAALGIGASAVFFDGPVEGATAYEQAYHRRQTLMAGAWIGVLVGFPGALLGLMAVAGGRPLRRAALFGALPLQPLCLLFFVFPYTTMLGLVGAPICAAGGSLSGLIAALLSRTPPHGTPSPARLRR